MVPGGTVERTTTVCRTGEVLSALPTDVLPAVNAAQVVLVAGVRRRQRQEDERVGLTAEVELGPHVVAAGLQLADAGRGDVDERDLVPGREEALAGGGPPTPEPTMKILDDCMGGMSLPLQTE